MVGILLALILRGPNNTPYRAVFVSWSDLRMIKIGLLFTVCIAELVFPLSLHQVNSRLRSNKQTQKPSRIGRVRTIEPNLLAPDLYSNKLKVRISLVGLPGADEQGSYWEATYKLYFISEAEYREVLKQILKQSAPDGGAVTWNPDPSLFPGKILGLWESP
ncbi:MAG: hypothetical protein ACREAB_02340 [Blastocatellia bacterium]